MKVLSMKKNNKPLFIVITLLFWFSMYTYVPIISPYAEGMGAAYKFIGLIIGSYGLTQMLLRIPIGVISDNINKRKIFIILGNILSFSSALGLWFSKTAEAVLVFRALSGAAAACWVIFTVEFSRYYKAEESSKAIGIINCCCFIGETAAMVLCGFISQEYGMKYTFIAAILTSAIGIILSFILPEEYSIKRQTILPGQFINLIKDGRLLVICVLGILCQLITCATIYGFTPLAANRIGANNLEIGMIATIATIPMIFSTLTSGTFISIKLGEIKSIAFGFILMAVSCLLIPFCKTVIWLYIIQLFEGFGSGLSFSLLMSLSIKDVSLEYRATVMGFFQATYGLGMFFGPVMIGVISDLSGLLGGFLATSAVGILGAILVHKLNKTST